MIKRIGFSIPNFDTCGAGEVLLNLALNLPKDLYQPVVICKHDRGSLFKVLVDNNVEFHILETTFSVKPYWLIFINAYRIAKKLKKLKLSVLYSYHYLSDYSEPLACKFAGIPFIYSKNNMSWFGSSYNSWKIRSYLSKSIICINEEMEINFFKDNSKVVRINHGVNFQKYSSEINFLERENIIITVANLVPVKGIEVLIEAFLKSNACNSWRLLIVGDDSSNYAINLKNKYLNRGNINFTGRTSNVKAYLDKSKIFVLPTLNEGRKEGFPGASLEAMCNGLVVIGSNICGISDQLKYNFDNLLFEPGNVQDLTDKINFYISLDNIELELISKRLKKHVEQNFSISNELNKHLELFNKIIT